MTAEERKKYAEENKLPEDVAKKYEMVHSHAGKFTHNGVQYDTRKISMAQAEMLAKDESFPFLKEKSGEKKTEEKKN